MSGYFYQDKKKLVIPFQVRLVIYAVCIFFAVFAFYNVLRIMPPEQLAAKWIDALSNRQLKVASSLVTEDFKASLADRLSDMRDISDNIHIDLLGADSSYTLSKPFVQRSAPDTRVSITVTIFQQGKQYMQHRMELVLDGRKWKVDDFY